MTPTTQSSIQTRNTLQRLGFSPRQIGYRLIPPAIHLYIQDNTQAFAKEIYPTLAKQFPRYSASCIERSIRYAISSAWIHGSPKEWQKLFPQTKKAPSNTVFISVMAEYQE